MIRLTAILFLLCLSTNLFATDLTDETENDSQDFTYGKHTTPGSTAEETILHDEENPDAKPNAAVLPEKKKNEPDSSYYSVNKFNFLFYFVYKLKYLDEELESDDTKQTTSKK